MALGTPQALGSFLIIRLLIGVVLRFNPPSRLAFQLTRTMIGDLSANLQAQLVGARVTQTLTRTAGKIARFAVRSASQPFLAPFTAYRASHLE